MKDLQAAYLLMQENCGIREGDTVRVAFKPKDVPGWTNGWADCMDGFIGKSGEVESVSRCGVEVKIDGDTWVYPFTCLEKIPKPHWRETVSEENPVLVYYGDDPEDLTDGRIRNCVGYNAETGYRIQAGWWKYAKRVPEELVKKLLAGYAETSEDE